MAIDINEKSSIEYLFPYFPEKPMIIDIGSNKGDWAEIINGSDITDYSLILFEPNKLLLDYTRVRFAYNKKISYEELAASKVDSGDVDFFYFTNENNELSSLYYNHYWGDMPMQKGKVKTVTIDSYSEKNDIKEIDFLKIDTEGAELDVLNGCKKMLSEKKIKFLQVEYGGLYKISGITFIQVMKFMEEYGYTCYCWDGNSYSKMRSDLFSEDYRLENFIFSHVSISNNTVGWNTQFKKNTENLGRLNFVLEIGTAEGLTAKYICEKILTPTGRMICVDPLEDYYVEDDLIHKKIFENQYEKFISNTKRLPIELIRKKSSDAYDLLKDYRFDLCYIDGDHSEEAVYNDGKLCFDVTKIGGHILFDDFLWRDETERGIQNFLDHYSNKIEIIVKEYQVLIKKISE